MSTHDKNRKDDHPSMFKSRNIFTTENKIDLTQTMLYEQENSIYVYTRQKYCYFSNRYL